MNKYEMTMAEMIEVAKIETIINRERQGCVTGYCNDCKYFGRHYCSSTKKAEALYDEGCRIVGEDEIVIKKSEHKALLLEQKRLKEMVDRIPCGYVKIAEDEIVVKKSKIGMLEKTIDYLEMEKAQLYKQREQAEQETVREVLQEMFGYMGSQQKFCIVDDEHKTLIELDGLWAKGAELAKKHGIELED